MVISQKYKYVFIEVYQTGSTAISSELCDFYDGSKILCKHSRYHEFLRTASAEEKKYYAFSGIRNPMDLVVSSYLKMKYDHKGKYTDPKEWRRNGGTIADKNLRLYKKIKDMSFEEYFKKYYKLPYDNWSSVAHSKFDFVIRFENIQDDFAEVLKRLHIAQKRELPQINKTERKENFMNYYTPEIRERAIYIFGPFMKKWGYSFPEDWNVEKIKPSAWALFRTFGLLKKAYWRFTKTKSLPG